MLNSSKASNLRFIIDRHEALLNISLLYLDRSICGFLYAELAFEPSSGRSLYH